MRKPALLVLSALFVLLSISARAEEWKKEFTTTGKPAIRVTANDADIQVSSWDRKETEALVITNGYKIGPGDVRITDSQSGDQINLEVHRPSHICVGICHQSVRIELRVPREADLNLHSGDGNVRVDQVKGELRLDSGDGELAVVAADGRLTANTSDGNIRAQGRFDALDLHTGDGNIDAEADAGSKITSSWTLRTGDGNLTLRLAEGLSADLDANTGDGHVRVDFPVTVMGSIRENSIRGKMNGGGPPLELRTGDGNIVLGKG